MLPSMGLQRVGHKQVTELNCHCRDGAYCVNIQNKSKGLYYDYFLDLMYFVYGINVFHIINITIFFSKILKPRQENEGKQMFCDKQLQGVSKKKYRNIISK